MLEYALLTLPTAALIEVDSLDDIKLATEKAIDKLKAKMDILKDQKTTSTEEEVSLVFSATYSSEH